jgi:hypothetical protein
MTSRELMELATQHPRYKEVRAAVESYGSRISIYTSNRRIVDLIAMYLDKDETDELKELIKLMKEADALEVDIEDLIANRKVQQRAKGKLDRFFDAFESDETKERLFILLGETGVGKSFEIERRYPDIIQYPCNSQLDPYTLCYHIDDTGKGLAPQPTPFLEALIHGHKVFLDEGNELPRDTLMFIQGFTDEKKTMVMGSSVIRIHPKFKIIMALNPPSDTDERRPIGDALLSRSVGCVMPLTDDIIVKRLNTNQGFLYAIRSLYNHLRRSGLVDLRDLNYRDYQKLLEYDLEDQLEYKCCHGHVNNIKNYAKIKATGEFQLLLEKVKKNVN